MKMDISLLILLVMFAIAVTLTLWKGRWQLLWSGLKQTGRTLRGVWFRVLLGMTLGGFIQVLIPSSSIAAWLGPASGLKGILIGSYLGLFLSGGPYMILPIIVAILRAGAGPGQIIALLAGGMLGVQEFITWNVPFLGMRLALSRYIISFSVPPLVGLAGGALYRLLNLA